MPRVPIQLLRMSIRVLEGSYKGARVADLFIVIGVSRRTKRTVWSIVQCIITKQPGFRKEVLRGAHYLGTCISEALF